MTEAKPGIIGMIGTLLTGLMSWAMKHDAELRVTWLLLSILIALSTVAWWVRKWWRTIRHKKKDEEL